VRALMSAEVRFPRGSTSDVAHHLFLNHRQ
jgi:hypothetical protein